MTMVLSPEKKAPKKQEVKPAPSAPAAEPAQAPTENQ
jgi:hypothetical protein